MKSKKETICLIMGIISIATCWILIGIVFGIIGIVFFFKSLKDGLSSKKPIVGIILSIIAIVLAVFLWIYTLNNPAPSDPDPKVTISSEEASEDDKLSEEAQNDANAENDKSESNNSDQQSDVNTDIPEANTSAMVDYIASEAEKSANQAATEEKREEAINYIYENYPDYFKDNETMENTMYYGYYLEYAYAKNGENNLYANLGIDAYQVVKDVYRGTEAADSDHVTANLDQIKDSLAALGYTVE